MTFLFTDIEGSTMLWQRSPAEMRAALERHDDLMRSTIATHGGHVFTTAGDSFAVAFQHHRAAAAAAISMQRLLRAEPWPEQAVIRVRIGLHTGDASERDGDYFGPSVNLAARLMGLAHGGQVVTSASTAQLLEDHEMISLGTHQLRDVRVTQEVFELPTGGGRFPPLQSTASVPSNLPHRHRRLFGRDEDARIVAALLEREPLVTIVGTGGIGKTSLAVEVAEEVRDEFVDGVWLCELADVAHSSSVAHAVLDALGTRPRPGLSSAASVTEHCRTRSTLIVLDNCEHVLPGVIAMVEDLAATAPSVRVL
ncbi:MAG: adenylate/guanylate cyclase domain-containing protein, partial [Actinomycetota bacterium]